MPDAYIWLAPGRRGGAPCVGGTRLPPECAAEFYLAGESVATVCAGYAITREQFLVACWYLGLYGPRTYQRRWKAWAKAVQVALAYRDRAAATPDPPR